MKKMSIGALCATLLLVPLGVSLAADGAIPIWDFITITEPGSYVLTRNITAIDYDDYRKITIVADDVDLDLGGFTITGNEPLRAEDVKGLVIHDGTITWVTNAGNGPLLVNVESFALRRLVIRTGDDIALGIGGRNGVVEDNIISHAETGIIANVDNVEFARNRISGGIMGIELNGSHNKVIGNISDTGINVGGSSNLILDNRVGMMLIGGSENHIERNHCQGSVFIYGYGLHFQASSNDNVYRGNTARGNNGTGCTGTASGGDFCDEGTNNTSGGGNFMPDEM